MADSSESRSVAGRVHSVSVVVPVYKGSSTLAALVDELRSLTEPRELGNGDRFRVSEVLLVDDNGPDRSDREIRRLADESSFVRPVWLSRNFGQHAATLAGMASTSADWIVTMDEDGQHDPASIAPMLRTALDERASVVYAQPRTPPPSHSRFRNLTSSVARTVFTRVLSSGPATPYHSFRLMLGEVGRSVAAYVGAGIFLDVALGWVTDSVTQCAVDLREESGRRSGYSTRALASHFWRLVLSSGTRPLRLVSVLGALFAAIGFCAAAVIFIGRLSGAISVDGWASLSIVVLVGVGLILFSLGLVAEYVGMAATMAMGKPPFLIVSDRATGPLGDSPGPSE